MAAHHDARGPQPGHEGGDAARPDRLPARRGGRPVPGRLQDHPGPAPGVRRVARARHADRRGGDRRRRGRRRLRRHAPDRRDDDVQLLAPGARPDRQPRGQVPLHVGRPDPLPHGDARALGRRGAGGGPALAGVRELVRPHPRPGRGDALDAEGREGAPEERDPGRQPGDLHGERGALQPQGRGARGGVHDPARPRAT